MTSAASAGLSCDRSYSEVRGEYLAAEQRRRVSLPGRTPYAGERAHGVSHRLQLAQCGLARFRIDQLCGR